MRGRRLVASLGVAVVLQAATLGHPDISLAAGSTRLTEPANNTYTSDILTGVSAVSPTDVWVVGNHPSSRSDYQPVVRHFDGVEWTRVGTFALRGTTAYPTSVQALSDHDVWVALSSFGSGPSRVAHWDGARWTLTTLPSGSAIYHLWVGSDSDVWAVGEGSTVEHFDGVSWATVQTPAPAGAELFGVSGSGSDDVWFAGRYTGQQNYTMVLMHWNGHSWFVKKSFSQPGYTGLERVVVLSPTDAWAVGWLDDVVHGIYRGLTLHWNGKHWADSYQDVLPGAYLYGVAATSPTDVWAVGNSSRQAVAGHWNGHAWHGSHPRSPGSGDNRLLAVSADSPSDIWAVGYWDGPTSQTRLIEHFDGTRWTRVQS